MSFLGSVQVLEVFDRSRFQLLFQFQGFAHAVADAVCLIFVANLDQSLVIIVVVDVVAAVDLIFLVLDVIQFVQVPFLFEFFCLSAVALLLA